ncbi:MAG: ATP-dependent helicase, partial [Acidobacteria bacterium]
MTLSIILTPRGHLQIVEGGDPPDVAPGTAERLAAAFDAGTGEGLLQLGAGEVGTPLPASLSYWRDFAARFVTTLCTLSGLDQPATSVDVPRPQTDELEATAEAAPPMTGAEYLTAETLATLWAAIGTAFNAKLAGAGGSVQGCLKSFSPAWNLVVRVHFHLAENRKDAEAPFAFLATYTDRLSAQAKPQHIPLGQALKAYAGAANKQRLLSLLLPVQLAAEKCPWLKAMVEEGEVFHPLRWTPAEALALLRDIPALEQSGVIVRVPASWKGGRPPRPRVTGTVGVRPPAAGLGVEALVDFQMSVTLDGETLTDAEIRALLSPSDGLAFLRGRWVEVDSERLGRMVDEFTRVERTAATHGITFAEAARLLAAADLSGEAAANPDERDWA